MIRRRWAALDPRQQLAVFALVASAFYAFYAAVGIVAGYWWLAVVLLPMALRAAYVAGRAVEEHRQSEERERLEQDRYERGWRYVRAKAAAQD